MNGAAGPSGTRSLMEIRNKLAILADAAKYDASCASSGARRSGNGKGLGNSDGIGICHSYTPDGRCVSLLKILLTNHCIYDCRFCVNRVSSDIPRARFTSEEVVALTLDFYRRNYIEGLFLCSGIIQSPDYTMEQMIAVARALREEHAYNGYIHLKAVPGASEELIAEAGRWADRLSANIELPTQEDLDRLAPEKKRETIETTMAQIRERRDEAAAAQKESPAAPRFAPAGQSTQMIVGASASPDADDPARRPRTSTSATACAASTTRPSRRSPRPTRGCRCSRRRCSASIASIRPTGCCASTASRPAS